MTLFEFDNNIRLQGYTAICGVDEAGRGPLAGPVYAAAVILPPDLIIDGVNDSKKLTEKKRELLYDEIISRAAACSIAFASAAEIDEINILQASLLAMRRAVEGLVTAPDVVLVDGNAAPSLAYSVKTVVGGDAVSAAIAAASILAKVARDRYMLELDLRRPEYLFAKHKGYPTKAHYEALDIHGPCDAHRRSFLKKWQAAKENGR